MQRRRFGLTLTSCSWPNGQAAAGSTGTRRSLSIWAPAQGRKGRRTWRHGIQLWWPRGRQNQLQPPGKALLPSLPCPSPTPRKLTCKLGRVLSDGGLQLEGPLAGRPGDGDAGCRGLADAHGGGGESVVHAGEAGAAALGQGRSYGGGAGGALLGALARKVGVQVPASCRGDERGGGDGVAGRRWIQRWVQCSLAVNAGHASLACC